MEQVDGETLAWFRDSRAVFEYRSVIRQFLPNPRQKRRAVNVWNCWSFSILYQNARHLLPVQISYQNSPKKFFRQKLNKINRLQKFFHSMHFCTGHAIPYTEHDENPPFTGGIGIGRPEIIPRRVQWGSLWHSVSIRLMIYGNVIAWRTGGLKFPDE